MTHREIQCCRLTSISASARSDLYTLGVLLYQMLVGRAPFVDDDAVVVMARHIKTIPVPPVAGTGISTRCPSPTLLASA